MNIIIDRLTLNEEHLLDFINNKNMSIDEIFNEINQLYGIKSDEDILLMEINELFEEIYNFKNLLDEDNLNEQGEQPNTPGPQQGPQKRYSEKEIEMLTQKQLKLSQQLQGEVLSAANASRNPQNALKIANNPEQYIKGSKASLAALPQDIRQNGLMPDQVAQQNESPFKKILTPQGLITGSLVWVGRGSTQSTYITKGIYYGLGIAGKAAKLLDPRNLFSNEKRAENLRSFALEEKPVVINGENTNNLLKNALQKDANGEYTNPDLLKRCCKVFNSKPEDLQNAVGDKEAINTLIKDNVATSSATRALRTSVDTEMVTTDGTTELVHKVDFPAVDGVSADAASGYNEGSVSIFDGKKWKYVAYGVGIASTIIFIFWWVRRRAKKKKQEQNAEMNGVATNESKNTILDEYSKEYDEYIKGLDIINESILDFFKGVLGKIKSIFNIPKWLIGLFDKGINAMVGLSQSVNEGLKNKTMNVWLARFCNILIAIGKIVLIIGRGFLVAICAPILAFQKAKKKNNIEKTQKPQEAQKSKEAQKPQETKKTEKKDHQIQTGHEFKGKASDIKKGKK